MKEAGGKHSKEEYDNRIMEANATIMGANATNITANATNVGAKKEKKTAEKGQILRKNDYLCKMKEKALAELSAPLEVEVTDLLREDNID